MRITPEIENEVDRLLTPPINETELASYLVENSNLPGPRGNLELLAVVASASSGRSDLIPIYKTWLELNTESPDPREYLPTVAAAALGSIAASCDPETAPVIERLLRTAANDSRWCVRGGAAMGLQRIGEADFAALHSILSGWSSGATFLEQRAIAAALAHPPILKRPGSRSSSPGASAADLPLDCRNQSGFAQNGRVQNTQTGPELRTQRRRRSGAGNRLRLARGTGRFRRPRSDCNRSCESAKEPSSQVIPG